MDRLARAGWLSHRPERLDGQLRRAAPCRPEGWYLYHGGDGQFPGQSADEQIAAHALVAARGQSPPPSSLRRLQWYAWFWLRTEILPSQRYATASGDCRLNPPNLRRSRSGLPDSKSNPTTKRDQVAVGENRRCRQSYRRIGSRH